MFDLFLGYLAFTQIIIIFVIFVLILVLFDLLSFDLSLLKYFCHRLCLLLSLWTDNFLLLLSN